MARSLDARSWHETQCAIVSSRVATHSGDDGNTYSVEITYDYEYDWQEYRGDRYDFSLGSSSGYERKARIVDAHPPGGEVTCYVDPDDPTRSVIDRSPGGYLLWGPAVVALSGGRPGRLDLLLRGCRQRPLAQTLLGWRGRPAPPS